MTMRQVVYWSRAVVMSLLLWAAAPALDGGTIAGEMVWMSAASGATTTSPLAVERRARRNRTRRATPAPSPRTARLARNPILRSQRLRASLPIYLRHCVLLR